MLMKKYLFVCTLPFILDILLIQQTVFTPVCEVYN